MRPWMRSNGSVANDQSPSASAVTKLQFAGVDFGCGGVMSKPRTWDSGCSSAKETAQVPVPQPTSRTRSLEDLEIGALWSP